MDNGEVMFWLAIVQQSKEGSKEATEMLQQENELRKENNQPTVEAELAAIAEEAEIQEEIEQMKQMYHLH